MRAKAGLQSNEKNEEILIAIVAIGFIVLAFPGFGYLYHLLNATQAKVGLSNPGLRNGISLFITVVQAVIIIGAIAAFFYSKKIRANRRYTRLAWLAILFANFCRPLLMLAFLNLNALASTTGVKNTTCHVMNKHESNNEIVYENCSSFEVTNLTVTPEQYALIAEGDTVRIQTKAGLWSDYAVSQEKIAQ